MNVPLHVLQVVNWHRMSAYEWVQQFGVWVCTDNPSGSGYSTPLAALIDSADKSVRSRSRKALPRLKITDDEARAVQRVLLDMMNNMDLDASKWAWVLIQHFQHNLSLRSISSLNNWSKSTVHRMIEKGLKQFEKITIGVRDANKS